MASLETIEQMFSDGKELSITQHNVLLEKISGVSDKVDHIEKKFDMKIDELEKSSNEFQTWKNYIIAIIILIGFVTPVVAQYLFR